MNTHAKSVFKYPSVVRHLSELHDKYVVHPADKAPRIIVFVCKSHYIDYWIKELSIDYTPTTLTKAEFLDNRRSVLSIFGTKKDEFNLQFFTLLDSKASQLSIQARLHCRVRQWLHKTPFKVNDSYSISR